MDEADSAGAMMAARELMACPDCSRSEKSSPVKRRRRPSCGDGQVVKGLMELDQEMD